MPQREIYGINTQKGIYAEKGSAVMDKNRIVQLAGDILNDIGRGEFIFLLNTLHGVSAQLYKIENGGYSSCSVRLFNGVNSKQSLYDKYESVFTYMMKNDRALHVLKTADGSIADYKRFGEKDYASLIYGDCQEYALLKDEYGLEPNNADEKEKMENEMKKVERLKKTLVYSCYMGDTQAIIERAKTTAKAQLDKKLDIYGTPLIFCAMNNDLEGFKAVAEAGADITKTVTRGTLSPLSTAIKYSPDIVLYVHEKYPDIFDAHFKNWSGGVVYTTDMRIYELMYSLYGKTGMQELMFSLVENKNAAGLEFALKYGVDFLEYRHSYYKCNALEFAKMRWSRYKDTQNEYTEVYELLERAAERLENE